MTLWVANHAIIVVIRPCAHTVIYHITWCGTGTCSLYMYVPMHINIV